MPFLYRPDDIFSTDCAADAERSLLALSHELAARRIASVAIPTLGCGLGGLPCPDVHSAISTALSANATSGCRIQILTPRPATDGTR